MQRLYGKYLRAESFRKALCYQKRYLLILLGGFQETEKEILSTIAKMGAYPDPETVGPFHPSPRLRFRSAARVIIACSRMKYLVKKWKRATRVGSSAVAGNLHSASGL